MWGRPWCREAVVVMVRGPAQLHFSGRAICGCAGVSGLCTTLPLGCFVYTHCDRFLALGCARRVLTQAQPAWRPRWQPVPQRLERLGAGSMRGRNAAQVWQAVAYTRRCGVRSRLHRCPTCQLGAQSNAHGQNSASAPATSSCHGKLLLLG